MKATMHMKRIFPLFLALALLLMSASAALAVSFDVRINSSSARVYSSPSTSASRSVKGVKGVKVTVTGYKNGWSRVTYKGNTGYIKTKYLNLVNRKTAYTNRSTAVYKSASTASRMGTLPIASKVYVIGVDGGYCRVQNASGSVTGYIKTAHLSSYATMKKAYDAYLKNKAAEEAAKPATKKSTATGVDKAIEVGKAQFGKGYAYSSDPPNSFNCSSFVRYCMGQAGYSMKGTAREQAEDGRYAKVDKNDIRKGDILCFDTDEDGVCDHTAICTSGGSNPGFIEASEKAGKVRSMTLNSWYRDHLMFARRP